MLEGRGRRGKGKRECVRSNVGDRKSEREGEGE